MDDLWGFIGLAVVLTLTPGPDDALVLSSSLRGGLRLGAATAVGIAAGSVVWGVVASVGLATAVSGSPTVYHVLRLAGAGYLVLLGAAVLLAQTSGRGRPVSDDRTPAAGRRSGGARAAFAAGVVSDVLNPKIGIFYLTVAPQFIPTGKSVMGYTLVLCAIDVAIALVWLIALAGLAHATVSWCRRPAVVLWSQLVMGSSLVGVGASVALHL